MNRLVPASLFGRILAILLVGLMASHAAGYWIYAADREQAVRAVGGLAVAQRIANATRLLREAPPEARPRLAGALADAGFRISELAAPPALDAAAEQAVGARALREMLARIAPAPDLPAPRVGVTAGTSPMAAPMMGPGWRGGGPWQGGPMAAGMPMLREVTALMPLPGGSWLAFRAGLPEGGGDVSLQFLLSMAVMAVVILGASILAVRQATRPLAALAAAADRLGRDVATPAIEEEGTTETRRAARAFNEMQSRLRHLLESRMQMLAAISHDLRTPLTLLRLRVENLPETEETARMLATIGDMEAMIASMLAFARDETVTEPRRRTDLAALLESLVDDMADAGLPVTAGRLDPVVAEARAAALKRAIRNLVDNAVTYGGGARASLIATRGEVEIRIEDDGPGLPAGEIARVTEPFYRAERSRSRETGGVGLGLAIAQTIAEAHGGRLSLANRAEGGLRASITLPAPC